MKSASELGGLEDQVRFATATLEASMVLTVADFAKSDSFLHNNAIQHP